MIEEAKRCRVILSELDRDVNTDKFTDDVTMPVSQVLQTMLDTKLTELSGLLELKTGALDDSSEPLSKPLPDLKYTLETLLDNATTMQFPRSRLILAGLQPILISASVMMARDLARIF